MLLYDVLGNSYGLQPAPFEIYDNTLVHCKGSRIKLQGTNPVRDWSSQILLALKFSLGCLVWILSMEDMYLACTGLEYRGRWLECRGRRWNHVKLKKSEGDNIKIRELEILKICLNIIIGCAIIIIKTLLEENVQLDFKHYFYFIQNDKERNMHIHVISPFNSKQMYISNHFFITQFADQFWCFTYLVSRFSAKKILWVWVSWKLLEFQ